MKNFKIFFTIAASTLILALYSINPKSAVCVYTVYDPIKVGEMNMVKAITEAFPLIRDDVEIIEIPNAKFESIKLNEGKTNIIVTAGQFGIELAKSAGVLPKNVKILLCTHQWFDSMKDLHNIYLTMPKHAINNDVTNWAKKQKIELITTQGVLHRMSAKAISEEDTKTIKMIDAKVGLILGGDAEMPNGKDWRLFSEESAKTFAIQICKYLKETGHKILITNGPRTGAFVDVNNRDPNSHKNGEIDRISKAFLDELDKAGFKQGEHFDFYDFQFGKPSALKAITAVVYKNKGFMIVPGESTSSISETISIMPIVIYKVDSMNYTHMNYLNDLLSSQNALIWPNVPTEQQLQNYTPPEPQILAVVKSLISH